jgi:hypothetical protein
MNHREELLNQFRAKERTAGECLTHQALTFPLHNMPGYNALECERAIATLVDDGTIEHRKNAFCLLRDV